MRSFHLVYPSVVVLLLALTELVAKPAMAQASGTSATPEINYIFCSDNEKDVERAVCGSFGYQSLELHRSEENPKKWAATFRKSDAKSSSAKVRASRELDKVEIEILVSVQPGGIEHWARGKTLYGSGSLDKVARVTFADGIFEKDTNLQLFCRGYREQPDNLGGCL